MSRVVESARLAAQVVRHGINLAHQLGSTRRIGHAGPVQIAQPSDRVGHQVVELSAQSFKGVVRAIQHFLAYRAAAAHFLSQQVGRRNDLRFGSLSH
jgi:hypothetical protein